MWQKFLPSFFAIILLCSNIIAQEFRKYENEFLYLGIGARNIAMAKSSIASEVGITAAISNPSAICSQTQEIQASAMHAEYFMGLVKYDYLGTSMKISDSSAIALSLVRSGVDNIANTLDAFDASGNLDYNKISYFSVADYAAFLSFSMKSKIPGLAIGANLKLIYRNEGKFAKGFGFGFDAAASYTKNSWKAAAVLHDASSTYTIWKYNQEELNTLQSADSTKNETSSNKLDMLAPWLDCGISKEIKIGKNFGLLAEIASSFYFDGKHNTLIKSKFFNAEPRLGIELKYKSIIAARIGLGNFQKIPDFNKTKLYTQPSVGLGLCLKKVNIDYAFTNFAANNSLALYSHIFSLAYSFNIH